MAEIVEHFCTRHGSYWPPTAVDHLFPCPKCKAEREERKQAAMRHLAMGAPAAAKAASDRVLSDISAMREIVAKSDKSVALLIQRGEDKLFVPVRLI